jgi:hypothetical protein
MNRSAAKAKFVRFWGPRIGDEAAAMRWSWANTLRLAYLLNFVSIPCLFLGVRAHITFLVVTGVAIYVGEGALLVLGALRLKASNTVASNALGIRIGLGATPGPPRPAAAYERWCKKYDITPYAAKSDLHA